MLYSSMIAVTAIACLASLSLEVPSEKNRHMAKKSGNFFPCARWRICLAHFSENGRVVRVRMRKTQESIAGTKLLESMRKE